MESGPIGTQAYGALAHPAADTAETGNREQKLTSRIRNFFEKNVSDGRDTGVYRGNRKLYLTGAPAGCGGRDEKAVREAVLAGVAAGAGGEKGGCRYHYDLMDGEWKYGFDPGNGE